MGKSIKQLLFSAFGIVLFAFICTTLVQGCRTPSLAITKPSVVYRPLVLNQYKHDTLITPRKQMTPEQLQDYLLPFYKANFDKLFLPEFTKLNNIINTQALSIQNLTKMITSIRVRSIRSRDSLQALSTLYQKELIDIQNKNSQQLRLETESNDKQLKKINSIVQYLIIGWAVLIFMIIGLGCAVYLLHNELKKLYKSLNYV